MLSSVSDDFFRTKTAIHHRQTVFINYTPADLELFSQSMIFYLLFSYLYKIIVIGTLPALPIVNLTPSNQHPGRIP
jgi:hypothetical protein